MLVVLACNVILFFVPFANGNGNSYSLNFLAQHVKPMYFFMSVLNVLLDVAVIISIFLFKNRILQFRIINIVSLLLMSFISLIRAEYFLDITDEEAKQLTSSFLPYLPIIASLNAFYAGKLIKKDEKLVRSADRIR
jgi:glucan phosphoethanolaminetransferase (alkaline phosphatase superfamily)